MRKPFTSLAYPAVLLAALIQPGPVAGQPASGKAGAVGAALPRDIDPDSRSRLPLMAREGGTAASQGAAAIRLHKSGVDVRWESPLGRALTELAILVAAREHD